jgi:flagellar motor switch protein FliM
VAGGDQDTPTTMTDDLIEDFDLDAAIDAVGAAEEDGLVGDLDAVLDAASDDEVDVGGVRRFDFNRPHTISRRFEQNLHSVAENFAKIGTIAFTNLLRMTAAIEFQGVRLCTAGDYLEEMPQPTCAATVTFAPLKAQSLIHLDIGLCFVFLKRLMGGTAEPEDTVREFTEIERGIFARLVERIGDRFREACSRLVEIDPQFVSLENNPGYLTGIPAGESLVVLRFLFKLDAVEGPLEIGIPVPSFGPVRDIFDPEGELELRSPQEVRADRGRILEMVQGTTTEVVVRLADLETNLEAVLALKEGDVLDLPQPVAAPLLVEIEGRDMFLGEAGRVGQHRAVKLTKRLHEE